MAYYKDLREHISALEKNGKLVRIGREINKDTELHPLTRLQFRGLSEEQRTAFLFENVVDSRGRSFDSSVAVCALAGSTEIYAIGMMCPPEQIMDKWLHAQLNPVQPDLVSTGPVHEEVHIGDTLLEHGGLDEFPIPISTPGYDVAPYFTSPYWITRDPETGIRNVGTYRAQVKSPTRTGVYFGEGQKDAAVHWRKCRERGIPLEAAIVVGTSPNIGYVSVARLPLDADELAVAGGIAGEPVEVVTCKTVDLEVPAHAEVVVEGEFSMNELEPEAPFGEALGYMGTRVMMPYFTVKCITHRKNPVWQSFISQLAPSESSKIKAIAWENNLYKYLKRDLSMSEVLRVSFHEEASLVNAFVVIQVRKMATPKIWQMLEAAGRFRIVAKTVIAVDEDINPWDNDAVIWAMSTRMQPHRDCRILEGLPAGGLDISAASPEMSKDPTMEVYAQASRLLIDATMKWPYPPVSLPKKEFMERALLLWQKEELPPLRLREPWYSYNLGFWTEEEEEQAKLATEGGYYRTGEVLSERRRKV